MRFMLFFLCLAPCMAQNTAELHGKLSAVAPVVGVSVGRVADKSTWRIDFAPEATVVQKRAAAAIIEAWTDRDWTRTARMKEIIELRLRIFALEMEKIDPDRDPDTDVQPLIDAARARIAELRTGP